jgi:hypothetical protein
MIKRGCSDCAGIHADCAFVKTSHSWNLISRSSSGMSSECPVPTGKPNHFLNIVSLGDARTH